jgi:hypothetical protein
MAIRNLEANQVSHFEDCGHDNRESTTWPYCRLLGQVEFRGQLATQAESVGEHHRPRGSGRVVGFYES